MRALLVSAGAIGRDEAVPTRAEIVERLRAAGWSASNIARVLGPVAVEAPQQSLAEPGDLPGKARTPRGDTSTPTSTPRQAPSPRGPVATASAAAAPLPRVDLTGRTFGALTVLGPAGRAFRGRHLVYECRCDCGVTLDVRGHNLASGRTASCGHTLGVGSSNAQVAAGEAQRARLVNELDAGAATPVELARRLGVDDCTARKHLVRLVDEGRAFRASTTLPSGTLTVYARTQAAADAAVAARKGAPARVVPPARRSEPRLIARVTPGLLEGLGDRHHNCARYEQCLDAFRGAGHARCPDGATDERLGCFTARDRRIDFMSAIAQRESNWGRG